MNNPGPAALTAAVLTRAGTRKGDEIMFRCPHSGKHQHGDRTPSAEYNPGKGTWHCFGCGEGGTATDLAKLIGLETSGNGGPSSDGPPRGVPKTYRGAALTAWWVYRDQIGRELGVVARFDAPDGRKQVIPYFNCSNGTWSTGASKALGPLYGLDWLALQPDSPVIVVEGEKCAATLQKHVIVAVTSQGGSSAASKTDWRPLAGRDVVIWPDRDEPGQKYAREVKGLCESIGCASVAVLDVEPFDLPEGGDVVDWLAAHPGASRDDLLRVLGVEGGKRLGLVRLSLSELLALDLPPRNELIAPWLRAKDLVMLYAWRGSGKTYVALSMGLALASGTPFLSWDVPQSCNVLYVDGEMPVESLQQRLAKLVVGLEVNPTSRFDFIAADCQERAIPSLATSQGQALIDEQLAQHHYHIIIIDNVSTLCRGAEDENSSESWVPVQEWLLKLRRRGHAVVLIHHAGKGGQQRGTSTREDVLDTVVALEKPNDYEETDGARFVVRFQKARGLDGAAVEPIEAKLIDSPSGRGVTWGIKDCKQDRTLRIIELYTVDKLSLAEIAAEVKQNKSTILRTLRSANIEVRGRWKS